MLEIIAGLNAERDRIAERLADREDMLEYKKEWLEHLRFSNLPYVLSEVRDNPNDPEWQRIRDSCYDELKQEQRRIEELQDEIWDLKCSLRAVESELRSREIRSGRSRC